jgi:DNA-binding MurR/RpiR family transcriptional regulator
MTDSDLICKIRSLDRLTPGETKIADFICRQYPEVAFDNVTSISQKAGVSKATVVRFIKKLGYDGFTRFRDSLRADMMEAYASPKQRFTLLKQQLDGDRDLLGQNITVIMKNLQQALARIDRALFDRIARLISTADRPLFVVGQRTSYGLAYMFHTLLGYVRPHTTFLEMQPAMLPDVLADIGPDDMLFAISFRRYARTTCQVARHFANQGATVMAMVDSEFSPLAEFATHQLVVPSEGLSMFRSRCAAIAVLESLAIAALQFCDGAKMDRSASMEALFDEFGVYQPAAGPGERK